MNETRRTNDYISKFSSNLQSRNSTSRSLGVSTNCLKSLLGVFFEKWRERFIRVAAMRIVLIEHNGERVLDIFDATPTKGKEFSNRADEFRATKDRAVTAARRHDESEGRYYWDYKFMSFCPHDCREGIDVFVCPHEGAVPLDNRLNSFIAVITVCFYVGYILCQPPTILIGFRARRSMSLS